MFLTQKSKITTDCCIFKNSLCISCIFRVKLPQCCVQWALMYRSFLTPVEWSTTKKVTLLSLFPNVQNCMWLKAVCRWKVWHFSAGKESNLVYHNKLFNKITSNRLSFHRHQLSEMVHFPQKYPYLTSKTINDIKSKNQSNMLWLNQVCWKT